MKRIIVHGCNGKMGQVIVRLAKENPQVEVVAGIDFSPSYNEQFPVFSNPQECNIPADAVIDFSTAAAVDPLLAYVAQKQIPLVLCTTGLSDETKAMIQKTAEKTAVFYSANMSLGVNVLASVLRKVAALLANTGFDIEVIEKHHNLKIDAPSGTAFLLADAVNEELDNAYQYVFDRSGIKQKRSQKEIGISAIRGGNIVGEHTVLFAGNDEQIEFTHKATSKEVFAVGALQAAIFVADKQPGLYDMSHIVG